MIVFLLVSYSIVVHHIGFAPSCSALKKVEERTDGYDLLPVSAQKCDCLVVCFESFSKLLLIG